MNRSTCFWVTDFLIICADHGHRIDTKVEHHKQQRSRMSIAEFYANPTQSSMSVTYRIRFNVGVNLIFRPVRARSRRNFNPRPRSYRSSAWARLPRPFSFTYVVQFLPGTTPDSLFTIFRTRTCLRSCRPLQRRAG